jgi:single-strand DNA-binding protein
MASFNKIVVVGYLGRDPELRYTADGTPVCSFSVATTERRKDKSGEFQDVTTWFRVSAWQRLAEVANQYLSKGKQVYIEGRLSQSEFTDRDGNTRTNLEIRCTDLQFLGARGEEGGGGGIRDERPTKDSAPQAQGGAAPISDDDIPF